MNQRHCHLLLFGAITVVLHTAPILAQNLVSRMGGGIMANGFFSQEEWADSSQLEINHRVMLYAKQDVDYLYIGIRTIKTTHTGLDLYIALSEKRRLRFHVSSALAEATYDDGSWSEWRWEQNRRWVANKIGLYHDGKSQRSSEPEGFEFQISKEMIPGPVVYLALHLKRPEYVFPSLQDREAFDNWIQLRIDDSSDDPRKE